MAWNDEHTNACQLVHVLVYWLSHARMHARMHTMTTQSKVFSDDASDGSFPQICLHPWDVPDMQVTTDYNNTNTCFIQLITHTHTHTHTHTKTYTLLLKPPCRHEVMSNKTYSLQFIAPNKTESSRCVLMASQDIKHSYYIREVLNYTQTFPRYTN